MSGARIGICVRCNAEYPINRSDYCVCGAPVLPAPVQDLSPIQSLGKRKNVDGFWDFEDMYPLPESSQVPIRLGEGRTPLLRVRNMGGAYGLDRWYLKADHLNPSGSFKDRGVCLAINAALRFNADGVVCASSGNAAGSAAMYAAQAGLACVVVVPESAPVGKVALPMAFGAVIQRVGGDYSTAFEVARHIARKDGFANVSTTFVNPLCAEGTKAVAYEIFADLGYAPDWIVLPISSGPLAHGIARGFSEIHAVGLADRLPRIVAVQPDGCAPIVRSFERNLEEVWPWEEVSTICSGLSDPLRGYPYDGTYTLSLVRSTDGRALAVSDEALARAVSHLGTTEGVFAEMAGAASVAGVIALAESGDLESGQSVVSVVTGSGFKEMC